MSDTIAVSCENLSKMYPMYKSDFQRLKGLFLPKYKPELFTALTDITCEFVHGEIVGIIGLNGSGKSTLSSIVSGITFPTDGKMEVNGTVSMLSVNAGMENHLTGMENIDYKGVLLGFTPRQIEEIRQDIIDFADIGMYMNQPVRTYSSGMRARLGFAISVHVNPDILIIDEALSVGDSSFAEKCMNKMSEFKENNKTILYVSHAVAQMKDFCDRILWLHYGKIIGFDTPDNILKPYTGFAREFNRMNFDERRKNFPVLEYYQDKYL